MASDVAGAFKVLIEAQPDQAVDAFQKILDASNKAKDGTTDWSSVVTGLNQGWELASKVIGGAADAIVTIGEKAFEAAKSVGEFVAAGGEYSEQKTQLDNLANSYGTSGDAIVQMIQKITEGTTSIGDTMRVAAKAVASGMSGPDMETALTYAKRWSEATGQEFDAVAESITNAMAKGKFAALKEMGLIVEKGASVSDIVNQMRDTLGKFGDSGQNISDSFTSLNNTWEEFLLKIGKGLNDIPSLGKFFGELSEAALDFVQHFDGKVFTEWGEVGLQTLKAVFDAFTSNWPSIYEVVKTAFGNSHTSAKEFFKGVTDLLFQLYESFGKAWNGIIDIFQGLNIGNWATTTLSAILTLFGQIAEAGSQLIGMLVKQVTDGVNSALGVLEALAINNPKTAEWLGIDPKQLEEARAALTSLADGAQETGNKVADFFKSAQEGVAGAFDNANQKAEGWKVNLDDIAKKHGEVSAAIDKIDYKPVAETAKTTFNNMRDELDAAAAKAADKTKEHVTKAAGDASKAFTEAFKGVGSQLDDAMKSVDTAFSAYLKALGSEDSMFAKDNVANAAKDEYERRVAQQEKLAKAFEKMANIGDMKREVTVNITVDGKDDAVGALAKEVLNRAMTDAEVEDVIVAGV